MKSDVASRRARARVRKRRKETNNAYDRARYRATARLIEKHRQEFRGLLAEERGRV